MVETISVARAEDMTREKTLVDRAQRREAGAFEALYRENVGRVYGLCLRMSADPARAEELTQEAFIRAWERLGTFRGESRFSTWMHELAVNVVLGDLRARARRPLFSAEDLDALAAEAPPAGPADTTRRDLEKAIAGLPPGARSVFVLHDVEGYRHEEIAALAGISAGTCKAQLHRARRLLRKALTP